MRSSVALVEDLGLDGLDITWFVTASYDFELRLTFKLVWIGSPLSTAHKMNSLYSCFKSYELDWISFLWTVHSMEKDASN